MTTTVPSSNGRAPSGISAQGQSPAAHVQSSGSRIPDQGSDPLTMKRAASLRWRRLQRKGSAHLDSALKRRTSRRRWLIAGLVMLFVALGASVAYNALAPRLDSMRNDTQDERLTAVEQAQANANAAGFPVASAESGARLAAEQCGTYSDQFGADKLNAIKAACNWNGHGVADMTSIWVDPDPALRANVTDGAYSAVPLRIDLANSAAPVLYYVPVHQTGPTSAAVVGPGSIFFGPAGFTSHDLAVDITATKAANSDYQAAISQFLAGASRFTVPGVTLPYEGGDMKAVSVDSVVVYNSPTPSSDRIVGAVVKYSGPTKGAEFDMRYAFHMVKTGEDWRIQSIGIDANTSGLAFTNGG